MERNLDQIVQSHQLAQARRAAGRPVWDHTIHIKALLDQDTSDEAVLEKADRIAYRLMHGTPASWQDKNAQDYDRALRSIIDEFNTIDQAPQRLAAFNECLVRLYDWADQKRVWIE